MIVTLTGASGTGKTTLQRLLLERVPYTHLLVSYTTRERRSTDIPGDFEYLAADTFAQMKKDDAFEWTTKVRDKWYGTARASLERGLRDDTELWMMIVVPECMPKLYDYAKRNGKAHRIRSFFFKTPPADVLRARMIGRGDSEASADRDINMCAGWEKEARASGLPYIYVDNHSVEEKLTVISQQLVSELH